jgi:hypothetical protein
MGIPTGIYPRGKRGWGSRRGFIPVGNGDGEKCPPQAFVGIPAVKFFRRGDGFGELEPAYQIASRAPQFIVFSSHALFSNDA